jgi:NOL1/NOP2/fmu family ribosome biogenesis protein
MFRDPVAVREWSPKNAALCSERQRRIVGDVWPSLKDNGILIYSTCTFNPAENEENILWLAGEKNADSVSLDVTKYDGIKQLSFNGIDGYGFYPGNIMGDGLFIAVVRKKGSGAAPSDFPNRPALRNSSKEHVALALKYADAEPLKVYTNNDFIIHIPVPASEFAYLSASLGIVKPGTDLLRIRGKDVNPLHDLALYTGLRKDAFPLFEVDTGQALSFLRRENFHTKDMPDGWIIISYRGVNLGFIKNIGSRINNYYPVGWRIRMASDNEKEQTIIQWTG